MREPQTATRRQRDELLRLLVESVEDHAIFLLDTDGRVLTWNKGARRIKGYDADEIVGRHFSIFYPAETRTEQPARALRVAAEQGSYEEEGWRVRKQGDRFWAHTVLTAVREDDGELIGFAKVTRDLSERKRGEEHQAVLLENERRARRETETALERIRAIQAVTEAALAHLTLDDQIAALLDRIRQLLHVDTVAVLLVSEDGTEVVARAARGLEEEVERGVRIPIGRGFAGTIVSGRRPIVINDLKPGDVLNPILLEKGIRSLAGVPMIVESRVIGVLHIGSLHRRDFTPEDVTLLQIVGDRVALAIDHARLLEAASAARLQAELAEATVNARDEFLSVAAHELKTPMTSAKAAAQLLKRSFESTGQLSPSHARALDTVDRQIDKLSQLVVHLLESVRVHAGQLTLRRDRTDLVALVRSVIAQVETTTARHELAIAGPEDLFISADALRLEQVVRNLLDNAVKFSPDGGRIDVELAHPFGAHVTLAVRDRGMGVAAGHRARLFERFYQAHPDRSGLGLGLYISRQIVEAHGGTIRAEFPADGGTRFIVSLPADERDAKRVHPS